MIDNNSFWITLFLPFYLVRPRANKMCLNVVFTQVKCVTFYLDGVRCKWFLEILLFVVLNSKLNFFSFEQFHISIGKLLIQSSRLKYIRNLTRNVSITRPINRKDFYHESCLERVQFWISEHLSSIEIKQRFVWVMMSMRVIQIQTKNIWNQFQFFCTLKYK